MPPSSTSTDHLTPNAGLTSTWPPDAGPRARARRLGLDCATGSSQTKPRHRAAQLTGRRMTTATATGTGIGGGNSPSAAPLSTARKIIHKMESLHPSCAACRSTLAPPPSSSPQQTAGRLVQNARRVAGQRAACQHEQCHRRSQSARCTRTSPAELLRHPQLRPHRRTSALRANEGRKPAKTPALRTLMLPE